MWASLRKAEPRWARTLWILLRERISMLRRIICSLVETGEVELVNGHFEITRLVGSAYGELELSPLYLILNLRGEDMAQTQPTILLSP